MEKTTRPLQVISTFTDKIDIIGDIHGCYHTLTDLLAKLGYEEKDGVWQHPSRIAVFIGDYIDRGLYTLQVLELIKKMTDAGTAVALLGNHEYNYIAINTFDREGQPYRPAHKRKQHYATDLSIPAEQRQFWIDWFKQLPLFVETADLRLVHAAWDDESIRTVKKFLPGLKLADNLLPALEKNSELYRAVIYLLKGPEITDFSSLPGEININHSGLRIKWWETYETHPTLNDVIVDPMPEVPVPRQFFDIYKPYPAEAKKLIFGHYTLPGKPAIIRPNLVCIDFSAYKKNFLAAYRYNGEETFTDTNLVYVPYNPEDEII